MHSSIQLLEKLQYSEFVADVVNAASVSIWTGDAIENASHLINGAASAALDTMLPASIRSSNGIFFTNHKVATRLIDQEITLILSKGGSVFDPACGAGNLLLAAASCMPLEKNLEDTIISWSEALGGCDINGLFVEASKARLTLLAIKRHGFPSVTKSDVERLKEKFTKITETDYLSNSVGGDFDVILTNPPYLHKTTKSDWSSGKTQVAGVFISKILERGKSGQIVVGILPDVLRSGSRYKKWRKSVSSKSTISQIDIFGKFSEKIDVDVFIVKFKLNMNQENRNSEGDDNWINPIAVDVDASIQLGSVFDVSVGPVVPHRHDDIGSRYPYLTARNTKPNSTIVNVFDYRGFSGKKYNAPFVVLRRTSSPGDANRMAASVIEKGIDVAVENHLIVISPKNKSLNQCLKLLNHLQTEFVRRWINQQIRCRHLTTGAIKSIPLPKRVFL